MTAELHNLNSEVCGGAGGEDRKRLADYEARRMAHGRRMYYGG